MNQVERDHVMTGPAPARPALPARPRPDDPRLSLAVPCYNEEAAIDAFLDRALAVCAPLAASLEIVCVDDGSRDGTVARILARHAADPRIRLVALSRNFGKEAALSAALDHCSGDIVVALDADLQHPPELIAEMIDLWRAGYDMVAATRLNRHSDAPARSLVSRSFYHVFNRIAEQPIPVDTGDFRLMDRAVVDALARMPERNRFMKGLFAWVGFRCVTIPYQHSERHGGISSFTLWKLWNFALDGITAFSTLPLRVWSYVGFAIAFLAFLYGSFIIGRTLIFGTNVPGYPSLFTVVLFLGGVQLISLGVLGEYIGRIMVETKGRPVYLVRQTWGLGEPEAPAAAPAAGAAEPGPGRDPAGAEAAGR